MVQSQAAILEVDIVTGRKTAFAREAGRALRSLNRAGVPFCVIGAAALAVRGLPRMTQDIDVVVLVEDAFSALKALQKAGFRSVTPVNPRQEPEPMYILESRAGGQIDLLVAGGEPESSVVAEAKPASVFGVKAPVASLEHLLLMYLYSNQLKHLGDFARIVTESQVDLRRVQKYLADVHPEMLSTFRQRVQSAQHPPPAPPRPPRRRSDGRK